MRLLLLTAAVLLGAACASQELPYDAPQVGVDGVAQVLGVERYGGYRDDGGHEVELVIWRTVREDGRECDEVAYKITRGGDADLWRMLTLSRSHTIPDAICFHADVLGVER